MPAKVSTPVAPHTTLLEGLNVKARADGSVVTVKGADGAVVAEVCVGKRATRLNLRAAPKKLPKGIELSGKSKSWEGGGLVVTDANVTAVRTLLVAVTAAPKS